MKPNHTTTTVKKRQLYQYNNSASILNGALYEVLSARPMWTVLAGISNEFKKIPHYNIPFRVKTADLINGIEKQVYTLKS